MDDVKDSELSAKKERIGEIEGEISKRYKKELSGAYSDEEMIDASSK
jgi:hypothetical protein